MLTSFRTCFVIFGGGIFLSLPSVSVEKVCGWGGGSVVCWMGGGGGGEDKFIGGDREGEKKIGYINLWVTRPRFKGSGAMWQTIVELGVGGQSSGDV